MLCLGPYIFKRAETPEEFEQIHRLNYRTFVGEIGQHPDDGSGLLVDKFHFKNVYWIVLREKREDNGHSPSTNLFSQTQWKKVVGMISAHDQPPFSIEKRLANPEILYREGFKPLEARLLAIEPSDRNSTVFLGLIWSIFDYAETHGYTHLFISGVSERQEMYERIGFVPLGPGVQDGREAPPQAAGAETPREGDGDPRFVPMVMEVAQLPQEMRRLKKLWEAHVDKVVPKHFHSPSGKGKDSRPPAGETICLLPGPVTTAAHVRRAFHLPQMYHRGSEFIERYMRVREILGKLVGGRDVSILNGSGTLANEVIAATLAAEQRQYGRGQGVLLSNGEFGERLARQAARFGLAPRLLSWAWGEPWDLEKIEADLAQEPLGSWIWGVHQESSTGMLNNLPGLLNLARKYGMRVCLDCISSLGAVPLDLREVYLASGASGKSLGAYAGAALIFADRRELANLDRSQIPSYFDIAAALASEGPCYTFPSPVLLALEAALQEYASPQNAQAVYSRYHDLGERVREHLRNLGIPPLSSPEHACPVITTFAPPGQETSPSFVARSRDWGYAIGGESAYLAQRRLVQIATMGDISWDMLSPFFESLEKWLTMEPALVG